MSEKTDILVEARKLREAFLCLSLLAGASSLMKVKGSEGGGRSESWVDPCRSDGSAKKWWDEAAAGNLSSLGASRGLMT